ncbi:MAG: DUF2304 domain-containing protein [Nitrospirota bacterium]
MPIQQKIVAISISLLLFVLIVDLVRRRMLREEYSWLWLLTGVVIIVLASWYRLLVSLTELIGGVLPTSTLFFFGLLFLIIINLYYSTKLSGLYDRVKDVSQELAILKTELKQLSDHDAKSVSP